MKKVLALGYSQTGQLHEILRNISENIEDIDLDYVEIQPQEAYPFPWDSFTFLKQMPKSFYGDTIPLKNYETKHEKYDLIILGYQVWYLSPSVPTHSILADEKFRKLAKDTDIVTVIGARNMWLNAQEVVKKELKTIGANLVGNIALMDSNMNMLSVLTITHWLLKGKKNRKWGIFPLPGVQQKDIDGAKSFGPSIKTYLNDKSVDLQQSILDKGGTKLPIHLMFVQSRAIIIFRKWGQIIIKKGTTEKKLKICLTLFRYYLNTAIFFIAPIMLTIFSIVRLFIFGRLNKQKSYYQGITLK